LYPPPLEAHRRALLAVQGADPQNPERALDDTMRSETKARAIAWAILVAMCGTGFSLMCFTGAHAHGPSLVVATVLGAIVAYALTLLAARLESTWTATVTRKFITRKKQRAFVVVGDRTLRVTRTVYDLLQPHVRYVVRANGAGAHVFDVAPEIHVGPYR
jgi:hypothetical protein